MPYQPIESYGIIGNMHTAALVGADGSIDWFCFPHFDSPSVFAALLDDQKGGRFRIAPRGDGYAGKQLYWPDTNVLITRFLSDDGVGEIESYMPAGAGLAEALRHQLFRRVRVVRGEITFHLECHPAFDYARAPHTTVVTPRGAVFGSAALALGLASDVPLVADGRGVRAEFTLRAGESAVFVLHAVDPRGGDCAHPPSAHEAQDLFEHTVAFWRDWLRSCTYTGRWREMVHRSALVLKLLTFEPTGAIIAAPTTSLPEALGGPRNWDYRYTWLRDAAFTVYGLMRIGFTEEAARFVDFLEKRCRDADEDGVPLQIVYGIRGERQLVEATLDHLDGYRGSRPVRIGNGAWDQLQLDIYGELLDSVYLFNKYGRPIASSLWSQLRRIIDWVAENWNRPDEGIWEVRSGRQHFVFSKLMCWVALDRGLRLADKRSFPADRTRWLAVRDQLYEEIMRRGWSERRRAFVQVFDGDTLDASSLIMPLVFFASPADPQMIETIDAILKPPREGGLTSDGLVHRYDPERQDDGVGGPEGTFNMCTFWLVEAMTRAGRFDRARLDQARLIFERMIGFANHLGLYAEETGPRGEALGNFPQGFTHIALISAAFNLDRTLNIPR